MSLWYPLWSPPPTHPWVGQQQHHFLGVSGKGQPTCHVRSSKCQRMRICLYGEACSCFGGGFWCVSGHEFDVRGPLAHTLVPDPVRFPPSVSSVPNLGLECADAVSVLPVRVEWLLRALGFGPSAMGAGAACAGGSVIIECACLCTKWLKACAPQLCGPQTTFSEYPNSKNDGSKKGSKLRKHKVPRLSARGRGGGGVSGRTARWKADPSGYLGGTASVGSRHWLLPDLAQPRHLFDVSDRRPDQGTDRRWSWRVAVWEDVSQGPNRTHAAALPKCVAC